LADLLERACGVPGRLDALTESALAYAYHNRRQRIIAPILPVASSGEPDALLPSPPTQPRWRFVSVATLILVVAAGAGAVFSLRNAPVTEARMSALPDLPGSSAATRLQAPVIRLPGPQAVVRLGSR
jgi:hypothetical protein